MRKIKWRKKSKKRGSKDRMRQKLYTRGRTVKGAEEVNEEQKLKGNGREGNIERRLS